MTDSARLARKAALNAVGDLRNDFAPSGLTRNKKPKRWSHQDELNTLKGRKLSLKVFGKWTKVTLIEADQFSVKVQNIDDHQQSSVTYFKHAIDAYAAV
jgi:hypothetical protein